MLYADDILLLSQSVSCMQHMLDICSDIAKVLDLKFNVKKSAVLRIAKRFNVKCSGLLLDGQVIPYVEEVKYLGVVLKRGLVFNRSFSSAKVKFYRCFNAIYSKAFFASEDVLVSLFKSYCLPIITYSCESVPPLKSDVKILNKLISNAFQKIFHTYDTNIISNARMCFGLNDIEDLLCLRQRSFNSRFSRQQFNFSTVIGLINRDFFC